MNQRGLYFKFLLPIFASVLTICSSQVYAATQNCSNSFLSTHPHNVLNCYITSSQKPSWNLVSSDKNKDETIYHYDLTSQFWPPQDVSNFGTEWHHQLDVIVPKQIKNKQSLLFITGGKNRDKNESLLTARTISSSGSSTITETQVAAAVSEEFGSIVAVLKQVPNQFISFEDGVPRQEDGIIAYSWNRFMDDPTHGKYWPAHIAMTKAAVSAMNLIQSEAARQGYIQPQHFIVSGASKRGWITWLTALADQRVNAIIPMVIDIFNVKHNLEHIYKAYNDWPDAFNDFVEQGVTNRLQTPEFTQLMNIEDPVSYMNVTKYRKRLSIPKLIINASSDEFFPPDSLQQYIRFIPGDNLFHTEANQSHHIQGSLNLFALISNFYQMVLDKANFPKVSWEPDYQHHIIKIKTDFIPVGSVTLWKAFNPQKRDFRKKTTGAKYIDATFEGGQCDKQTHSCVFTLNQDSLKTGFTARYLDFTFNDTKGHALDLTSPVFINQK
ncbi:hypothetical protein JQC92_11465 [Shewanella sp. 202IG2-18]|uniref:PhoPQ-activated protein PqaA family protein n=1 Tax=Parashewanella hymeniacidonis TaxID=2807618 RepID=UPI001960B3F8|nr:PhoPQ-activated protein PqaA family protein [Parashewanella hymeniacidonis]MBM7072639.1 hypothetical protein [Parashewanella hymeniacidonis]